MGVLRHCRRKVVGGCLKTLLGEGFGGCLKTL